MCNRMKGKSKLSVKLMKIMGTVEPRWFIYVDFEDRICLVGFELLSYV